MAGDDPTNMVLRTIYLPTGLDTQLKWMAIHDGRSKNYLMRELIQIGLQQKKSKIPAKPKKALTGQLKRAAILLKRQGKQAPKRSSKHAKRAAEARASAG
jgi:hypothetical protein